MLNLNNSNGDGEIYQYRELSLNSVIPFLDVEASEGIFDARANITVKYIAHIMLSVATPAAMIDGETPRALETATKLTADLYARDFCISTQSYQYNTERNN